MSHLKTNGVGCAAKEVVDRVRSIVRLEIELALLEIKTKLTRIGVGIGFGAGAAVVAVFALGFLSRRSRPRSRSAIRSGRRCSIVGVVAARDRGVARLPGACARSAGAPPMPEEAIEEAKLTTETLMSNGHVGRPRRSGTSIETEREALGDAVDTRSARQSGKVAEEAGVRRRRASRRP